MSQFFDQASLVMVPSGYKNGKVYSQKPLSADGEITFTRASNATRVGPNGLIQKVRQNVLLQSNSFDTTWLSNATTETGGQAGYDGTNNAWLLQRADGLARFVYQTTSSSGLSTFSVYAKEGNTDWLFLANGSGENRYFDLGNGTLGNTGTALFSKIESVGNGWYRCSISVANGSEVRIYPAVGNGAVSGLVGANVFIQDAMLEQGDVMTEYVGPTTTAAVSVGPVSGLPRLDYSGGATCPSLKLEPQRSNLVTFSESFDNAAWTKTNTNVTANAAISPDGYQNADKIISTATNAFHDIRSAATITLAAGNNTISLFAKADGYNFIELGVSSSATFAKYATIVVNLANGTNANTGVNLTWTIVSSKIEDYGNGYYRVSLTFNVDASTSSAMVFMTSLPTSTRGVAFLGNGTSGALVYGAQVEAGSYPTSYIPTLSTSVTRVRDEINNQTTPIANAFTDNTKGTIFFDLADIEFPTGANAVFRFGNSSSALQFAVYFDAAGLGVYAYNGGVFVINVATTTKKFAIRFDGTQIVGFSNGVKQNTANVVTSFNIDQMTNNTTVSGSFVIKQFILFPSVLTDQQCIELTTI